MKHIVYHLECIVKINTYTFSRSCETCPIGKELEIMVNRFPIRKL